MKVNGGIFIKIGAKENIRAKALVTGSSKLKQKGFRVKCFFQK